MNKDSMKDIKNNICITNPELLEEWDYSLNDIKPTQVSYGSNKKAWWCCKNCGNKWQSAISTRSKGIGCPSCSSRMKTSFPEQAIYYYLKQVFPDAINRYQMDISGKKMELDIYVPSINFAIEYDGLAYHSSKRALEKEIYKYTVCKNNSITLLRVKERKRDANDISFDKCAEEIIFCSIPVNFHKLDSIIEQIADCLGISITPNCSRDNIKIREQYYSILLNNSIATSSPRLMEEWNYERNGSLTPYSVFAYSAQKIWWKCKNGHEWFVSPNSRMGFNSGCPYCGNKKLLTGYNDIATTHPESVKYWDFERNTTITPDSIIAGNNKIKIWWTCDKGHHFVSVAQAYFRMGIGKCPICSGKKVLEGFNDLKTVNPKLASEWHPTKNVILPSQVTQYSNKKVWWICSLGHEWEVSVNSRSNGSGCPFCSNKKILKGFNDLVTVYPSILSEWDYDKNTVSPDSISAKSSIKVWWKCIVCGYSWLVAPYYRVKDKNNTGCPACSNNTVNPGYNDFATQYPDYIKYWNYEKNGNLLPNMVGAFSEKKVWWKCDKGHEYLRAVKYMSRGQRCPKCYGHNLKGINQIDPQTGSIIATYESLSAAAQNINNTSSLATRITSISKASHKHKQMYGFLWEIREE